MVGWGTAFFDFNNDGWLDLFLSASEFARLGEAPSAPEAMLLPFPNLLFENRGDSTFLDVTPVSWQQQPKPSMGVAYADYDHDGQVDLVVGNFTVGYSLYRNASLRGAGNHWLTVRLEGRPPVNRDAIGARVFVTTADGLTRMQEVKSGSSLGAGNDTALHFGLGESMVRLGAGRVARWDRGGVRGGRCRSDLGPDLRPGGGGQVAGRHNLLPLITAVLTMSDS